MRLFSGEVHHQDAIHTAGFRSRYESLRPIFKDGIKVSEKNDRGFRLFAYIGYHVQCRVHGDAPADRLG